MRIAYDKLVRDGVPPAIEADGHTYRIEVLSPDAYIVELKRKLVEEAREALQSSTQDDLLFELADLMEVIVSLLGTCGTSPGDLEAMRLQRREEKGGFEQRLLLRYVDHAEPPASE